MIYKFVQNLTATQERSSVWQYFTSCPIKTLTDLWITEYYPHTTSASPNQQITCYHFPIGSDPRGGVRGERLHFKGFHFGTWLDMSKPWHLLTCQVTNIVKFWQEICQTVNCQTRQHMYRKLNWSTRLWALSVRSHYYGILSKMIKLSNTILH